MALAEAGVLDKYGVELIGAKDRCRSRRPRTGCCSRTPCARSASKCRSRSSSEPSRRRLEFAAQIGYPVILRPSFTLGGTGGGIAYNREELDRDSRARARPLAGPRSSLIEESVLGWKEFELEVMRDLADNAIIVCSIENFDPMGVHTGDSITVAPAQTLTDREYQMMRDAALRASARSAWILADPTCSSPSTRRTAAWSSSR